MPYYAHSKNLHGQSQLLMDHSLSVSELSAGFAKAFGAEAAGRALGLLHDLGKADPLFQDVLEGRRHHVNHWAAGATAILAMYERERDKLPLLADIVYAHHGELGMHPGLRALGDKQLSGKDAPLDEAGNTLTLFGQEALAQALRQLKLPLPKAVPPPPWNPQNDYLIQRMLWMRLLLSALVDADYSDTARHHGQPLVETELNIQAALEALEAKRSEVKKNSKAAPELNSLRDRLFAACLAAAERPKGLYTLTAPTGLGKTLALLGYALYHAKKHGLRRIVIVLPYLSLMEQNVKVYRDIVPELLESHSMATWTDDTRLLAERWEAPLIVTTSVQFFEALFKSRAPDCRKLHQLSQSVVVFDEAQTLPGRLLPPTLRSLKALRDLAGCTVVFSTATQPSYDSLTDVGWQAQEIVENVPMLYQATRRVTIDWRVEKPVALEALAVEVAGHRQSLTILNLRKHARELAGHLRALMPKDALFYLTTDLCPAHREKVLETIHDRLKAGLPCTLVATQCVEAGVDLDFPVLYRALAPLESVIQAAGRCNRNGAGPDGRVTVFVPQGEGRLYPDPWYQWGAECVRIMLSQGPLDAQDPKRIKDYFDRCYSQGAPEHPRLAEAIRACNFATVAKEYKLINDDQYHVVVPWGQLPTDMETLAREGLTPKTMRALQPYTVSTYDPEILADCELIPLRTPDHKLSTEGSRWYWLDNPARYDGELLGLSARGELADHIY